MVIKQNDWIEVEYTGKLKNGDVFDTSKGREPLRFKVGAGMVIPGFDAAVISMEVGNDKNFMIPFAEAYGPKNKDAVEIPKTSFKEIENIEKGKSYNFMTDLGPIKIDVEDVLEDKIKATVNHPLAGEDLEFDIKIVKILSEDEAQDQEKLMQEHANHAHKEKTSDCACGDPDCDCDDSCDCGHDH